MEPLLAQSWAAAVRSPAVAAELEAIYDYIAAAVESRRPVCVASGRCCKFDEWGHRLYVTGIEAAYTVARLSADMPRLNGNTLGAARAAGGCPFQLAKLCGAHAVRPLGCRIYFCDETAQEWQQELYERLMREVRALHDRHAIEYRYGEWREMLGLMLHSASETNPQ
jgi:Fe-S-cluster containining protein